ncbi:MAG TPA: hypothetical protein VGS96_11865 [Thermoanaerobaculia bacterium]|jgi:hypothetical protein|nr:hypothetical protein [Thermoanaerobaculia bacterium]
MNPSDEIAGLAAKWRRLGFKCEYQQLVQGAICESCGGQSMMTMTVLNPKTVPDIFQTGAILFLVYDHHSSDVATFELPLVAAMEFSNRLVDAIAAGSRVIAEATAGAQ